MKKLTLLLAALSVASAAYAKEVMPAAAEVKAAPALTVTSVGQFIEIDNRSGATEADGNVGHVMLGNTLGLAYDDWSFGLMARKGWDTDTDDGFGKTSSRIDLDAWKSMGDYSLGFRWRQESGKDRYLLRTKYAYGAFSGNVDFGYEAHEGKTDNLYLEAIPVKYSYGPFAIGYYVEGKEAVGAGEDSTWSRHQVRLYAPLYSNEKLSLNAEYRYQFLEDNKDEDNYNENNLHIVNLSANYAVTEALSVSGYYLYEIDDYEKDHSGEYYGEFVIGWNYSF